MGTAALVVTCGFGAKANTYFPSFLEVTAEVQVMEKTDELKANLPKLCLKHTAQG